MLTLVWVVILVLWWSKWIPILHCFTHTQAMNSSWRRLWILHLKLPLQWIPWNIPTWLRPSTFMVMWLHSTTLVMVLSWQMWASIFKMLHSMEMWQLRLFCLKMLTLLLLLIATLKRTLPLQSSTETQQRIQCTLALNHTMPMVRRLLVLVGWLVWQAKVKWLLLLVQTRVRQNKARTQLLLAPSRVKHPKVAHQLRLVN